MRYMAQAVCDQLAPDGYIFAVNVYGNGNGEGISDNGVYGTDCEFMSVRHITERDADASS